MKYLCLSIDIKYIRISVIYIPQSLIIPLAFVSLTLIHRRGSNSVSLCSFHFG